MKNKVLDIPYKETFADFLETKESICWQSAPQFFPSLNKNEELFFGYSFEDIRYNVGVIILILFSLFILLQAEEYPIFSLCFVIVIIIGFVIYSPIYHLFPFKDIQYAITQKKMIFKFVYRWSSKIKIHTIPFENISRINVIMEKDLEDIGTIFIYLKNPNNKPFKTRNIRRGGERFHITMELIEHPNEVIKLIQRNINNNKV